VWKHIQHCCLSHRREGLIFIYLFNFQVVTGIFSSNGGFQVPTYLRCHQLVQPWVVNSTKCRTIDLYRYDEFFPPSPLNDPNLLGTADSVWGAQCGSWAPELEAMVAMGLHYTNRILNMKCCQLQKIA
jgi:hypothetical protein